MPSINSVHLLGHLGQDPEFISTEKNGKSIMILKLNVATTFNRKVGEEWVSETDWHRVTLFGPMGSKLSTRLKKGSLVFVDGRIKYNSYTDASGVKKYTTDIMANSVILASGGIERTASDVLADDPDQQMQVDDAPPF